MGHFDDTQRHILEIGEQENLAIVSSKHGPPGPAKQCNRRRAALDGCHNCQFGISLIFLNRNPIVWLPCSCIF